MTRSQILNRAEDCKYRAGLARRCGSPELAEHLDEQATEYIRIADQLEPEF